MEQQLILILCTIALACFVQSVTGFGFGLVSMALLPLFITFKEAYFILMIPNLIVCTMNFLANHRHYQWRQGLALLVASCVAVPIGFYIMISMKSNWLMFGLGILICLFASSELILSKTRPLKVPEKWGWPMGLFSGCLSGAFNMGGPPAVAYVYSQAWAKEHIVALLQLVFGTSSIVRLALMQERGMITPELLKVSFFAIVPLLGAMLLGNRILKGMAQDRLRVVVFVFLLLIGLKYILNANPIHPIKF